MALKSILVSDVPNVNQVRENPPWVSPTRVSQGVKLNRARPSFKIPNILVVGHRGHGTNMLHSSDARMRSIKENSIASFDAAAKFPIDYIEFDVQVTKDDCPVIFHDNFILSADNNLWASKRTRGESKISVEENKRWDVETDDSLCTLQEAFQKVEPSLGFNIELKLDDNIVYQEDYLIRFLQAILLVVFEHAQGRPIIFSSFQPDAALLVRKLQDAYLVFFLTEGGTEIYYDVRRNSLKAAIEVCLEGGLEGIVSDVKGVFTNPGAVNKIKESKLSLLTYGKLNNVVEAVYMQHLMGIDGVIVDLVKEITEEVSGMINSSASTEKGEGKSKPQFSERELAFLLKLIPKLTQQH